MNDSLISQLVLWLLVLVLSAAFLTSRMQPQKKNTQLVMQGYGLPLRDRFPVIEASQIQAQEWKPPNEVKGLILLFTSATCQSCQGVYPIITEYARKNDVGIVLYMEGSLELIHKKIEEYNIQVPVFHFTGDLIKVTKVPAFPYAYYVSLSGIIYNKGGTQKEEEFDILLQEGRHLENVMSRAG